MKTILDRFAAKIARKIKRRRFDNKEFWNTRYRTDMEMGSGPGSRNENLVLKRNLIADCMESYGVTSILDLGCGDIEIIRDLEIGQYHGVDISDVVIDRNRTIRPDFNFECNAIRDITFEGKADLVLCLDVLIHQKSREDYETVIKTAFKHVGKVALISGYAKSDGGWNVFFYEDIEATIRRIAPDSSLSHVASYRDTELFAVVPSRSP
ncbi:MAG: methyltransferase domain-containing protein [Hyphomicrobiales bacterium]|nr:methyltransferase domain-containing protein [Hyphomicrobiales bacterium]MCP5372517.1 methyltransferase domain-containing protein [Hyphomicrobiales bacterium]